MPYLAHQEKLSHIIHINSEGFQIFLSARSVIAKINPTQWTLLSQNRHPQISPAGSHCSCFPSLKYWWLHEQCTEKKMENSSDHNNILLNAAKFRSEGARGIFCSLLKWLIIIMRLLLNLIWIGFNNKEKTNFWMGMCQLISPCTWQAGWKISLQCP